MERLFGLETEYAFAALSGQPGSGTRMDGVEQLMEKVRARMPFLPALDCGGIFMPCGRLYVDSGRHPEFCTPECPNPWDAVRYVLAAETVLATAAAEVEKLPEVREVVISKCNVDYSGNGTTWGCHESYLYGSLKAALADNLIPHLVSRLIYTGAGGFQSQSPGLTFTLSPRVWHLLVDSSGSSTSDRGIYHTKNESLSAGGYSRLHLLCGESLCSHLASWLKVGTTALVVAMIEAGLAPPAEARPADPLEAMRTFAQDPTCTAQVDTATGGRISAIQLQRRYLELAECHVRDEFMPPWAQEVCREWRSILDLLEQGAPHSVATTLDWAIKLALFQDRVARNARVRWEHLEHHGKVLGDIQDALHTEEELLKEGSVSLDKLLAANSPIRRQMREEEAILRSHGLGWEEFRAFLILRQELHEVDFRFGQLGPKGIFAALDGADVLDHRLSGVDNIGHAMRHGPAIGRGGLRGNLIRELSKEPGRYLCNWYQIRDLKAGRYADFFDPFATAIHWENIPVPSSSARSAAGQRLRHAMRSEYAMRAMMRLPVPTDLHVGEEVVIVDGGPYLGPAYAGRAAIVVAATTDAEGPVLRIDQDEARYPWRPAQMRRLQDVFGTPTGERTPPCPTSSSMT